jgi:MFS family permease
MNRNLWLLAICQGLFLTNSVTFIGINGLVGFSLAPLGWMATLPVMGYVVGGALSTALVARTQLRWGRKRSFQLALLVALVSTLLCAYAVVQKNFWLVCAGTLIAGYYNASANLYAFAAVELASASWREKAISLVMAGGLLGAVLGPNLAQHTRMLLSVPFAGAYLSLSVVALLSLLVLSFIEFPPKLALSSRRAGRPLRAIITQPAFVVAAMASALDYGVMNLLMAATPIAMQQCSLPFSDAAFVLQWHVVGMFAPGFFTGHLIKRLGIFPVMWAGVALNVLCIAVALSGVDLNHFLVALVLQGVGWNFLLTGGTTLSLQTYTDEEKDSAQGALNFIVFATMVCSSFLAGVLVTTSGWNLLNYGSLVLVSLIAVSLAWLGLRSPRTTAS